ncbi:MAG TPA: hypothetical protein VNE58_00810 [Casimicrobiaceae bacterium]|nr:hypothetical protein [Casimicrobiaceae bacterium]
MPLEYRERIVRSRAEDTLYCERLFDVGWPDAPHRVIRNRAVDEWIAAGRPASGERPGEGTRIGTVTRGGTTSDVDRYAPFMLTPEFEGDAEYAPFWAGESCSLIDDMKPAGDIVADLVAEARRVIARLQAT